MVIFGDRGSDLRPERRRSTPTATYPACGRRRSRAPATHRTSSKPEETARLLLEFAADAGDDSIEAPPPDIGQDSRTRPDRSGGNKADRARRRAACRSGSGRGDEPEVSRAGERHACSACFRGFGARCRALVTPLGSARQLAGDARYRATPPLAEARLEMRNRRRPASVTKPLIRVQSSRQLTSTTRAPSRRSGRHARADAARAPSARRPSPTRRMWSTEQKSSRDPVARRGGGRARRARRSSSASHCEQRLARRSPPRHPPRPPPSARPASPTGRHARAGRTPPVSPPPPRTADTRRRPRPRRRTRCRSPHSSRRGIGCPPWHR